MPTAVDGNKVTFRHRKIDAELAYSADKIILAIGQEVDAGGLGLEFARNRIGDENLKAGEKLYVVGDVSADPEKTVVGAVAGAKRAAAIIDEQLGGK